MQFRATLFFSLFISLFQSGQSAATASFDTSQLGRIVFALSSLVKAENFPPQTAAYIKGKAGEAAVQLEMVLNLFLNGEYARYEPINEAFMQLYEDADEIGIKREMVEHIKPWELRKLRNGAEMVDDMCREYINEKGALLAEEEHEKIVTLKRVMFALREYIYNKKYVHIGNRKDAIFDILYHRPIEWLRRTRFVVIPAGILASLFYFANRKSEGERGAEGAGKWKEKEVDGKKINVFQRDQFLQLHAHNQFSPEVSGLCKSSVFCGGLSATLGLLIRDVDEIGKMYALVNDFEELKKRIPNMIAATARLRIQNVFGETPYSGITDSMNKNGKNVDEWVAKAKTSSDASSRIGKDVISYIERHAQEIKRDGLKQWAEKRANGKTHRQHLEEMVATDWHEKTELEKILENQKNITVVDDVTLGNLAAGQDMYSYLSSLNTVNYDEVANEIRSEPLAAFARLDEFAQKFAQVYKRIWALRERGTPQTFVLRFGPHWISGKVTKKADGKFQVILVDTANGDRTGTSNAQRFYLLFTQKPLPDQVMFEHYISFALLESILRRLRGYVSTEGRPEEDVRQAREEYDRGVGRFMHEWIAFADTYSQHPDMGTFTNRFDSIFNIFIKQYYTDNFSGTMPVFNASGRQTGTIDISKDTRMQDIVRAYKQQLEG